MIGSVDEDVLLLDEPNENVYVNMRHTKDFQFVTVNTFSTTCSKVLLLAIYLKLTFCNVSMSKRYNNFDHVLGLSDECS